MAKIKKPIINYTGRDFSSIKRELVNYAQKYYPETFRDFSEASFGSLMLDMVAYVGDMISFYTDYQANESYLDTALEYSNVLKLSKQIGYRHKPNASSFGEISFFVTVPTVEGTVAPDYTYAPILKKGSTVASSLGQIFTLIEDVDFSQTQDAVEVATSNPDGTSPTRFALKAKGLVVSGELSSQDFSIERYEKFLSIQVFDAGVTEVISVFDSKGNNYYEVDHLTQDVIYVPVLNTTSTKQYAKNIYKPISAPRRFITEFNASGVELQFGFGTEDNEDKFLDPTSMSLDIFGKEHITEKSFDPTVFTKTSKLGIVPSETTLTVIYRSNSQASVSAPVDSINTSVNATMVFINENSINEGKKASVRSSLELTNEKQISGDTFQADAEEIKLRAKGAYSAQNRAVTKEDYEAICYNMPSNFGTVKRVSLLRDQTSFNGKNLNLYVISSNTSGFLIETNNIVKQNLRNWINQYKMIGDTIDILDARIINLKIDFQVAAFANVNKFDAIEECVNTLSEYYSDYTYYIGEPFKITEVYKILNNIPSVIDTKLVTVTQKTGLTGYSSFEVEYDDLISADGRYLVPPENSIFEIKFPTLDITGEVV